MKRDRAREIVQRRTIAMIHCRLNGWRGCEANPVSRPIYVAYVTAGTLHHTMIRRVQTIAKPKHRW